VALPSTAHPVTVTGCPVEPAAGDSIATNGPGVTRRIGVLLADCPSGLTIVMLFSPGVALTVEMLILAVVKLVSVMLLTATPGIVAATRHRYPAPRSKNADPPLDVAVTCRSIDATPLATTDGVTLTGVAAPGPTVRAICRPYEFVVSVNCCTVQIVEPSHPSTIVSDAPPHLRPREADPGSPGGLYAAVAAVRNCGARSVPFASLENRSATPALMNSFVPAALNPISERPRGDVAMDGTK
jgi:hypothetical protein